MHTQIRRAGRRRRSSSREARRHAAHHLFQKPRCGGRIGLEESEQLIGDFADASRGRMGKIILHIAACPRESIRAGVQAISPQVRTPAKIWRDHGSFGRIEIEIAEAIDLIGDSPFRRKAGFIGERLRIER